MNIELIIAVIFYGIVGFLIYKNRKKFEVMSKIMIVHKTQLGIKLMQNLAQFEIFWKIWSTVGIPVAVYFAFKVISLLWNNAVGIIAGTSGSGVALAIPGVKIPGSPIFIPLWYGIISIAVLATVHEFAHGVIAAMEGVRIKSTGFGFLAIIPLAFVELDEDQMKDMPKLSRMRIAAAGAFMNISMFFLITAVLGFLVAPFLSSLMSFQGIEVTAVTPGQPAELAGLRDGAVVTSVNGVETMELSQFINAMSIVKPGETVVFGTDGDDYSIKTINDPNNHTKSYIGVFLEQVSDPTQDAKERFGFVLPVMMWFYGLFVWIANLNLMIGVLNFLPIWILDGGIIFHDLISYVLKNDKVKNIVVTFIFAFVTSLLLFNLVGPMFKNFFLLF